MQAIINTKLILEDSYVWDGAVTFENGRIVQCGKRAEVNIPADAELIDSYDPEIAARMEALKNSLKYSIIVLATLPMLAMYPFVQKYFVKGVMIGSIKG